MSETNGYQFLARRPDSAYRQLFVKGRKIAALTLYMATVPHPDDEEGDLRTPEQVAEDFDVPLEAVREAIRYCESKPVEIDYDIRREDLLIEASNMNHPEYRFRPQELNRLLTADDYVHIERQLEAEFGRL